MNSILCLSGGLDSYIAYHYLNKPPTIYFYTSQPHSQKEWQMVNQITDGNCILDVSLNFSKENDNYIPHRNLLFASRASRHAERVWIAGLKDDMVEDKTREAFNVMSDCLSSIGKTPVVISSPFWDMTKTDICKWFVQYEKDDNSWLNVTENKLNNHSISCYSGGSEPCFKCESCFRKACAMHNAGMCSPFNNTDMVQFYLLKAFENHYIPERNKDIIKYANWYNLQGYPDSTVC